MSSQPLVSVIVPCFNQGEYLAEALNSVLAQSYPNWECVIMNDGSTDDTALVARQYTDKDARFKYIYQKNKGLPGARNAGISHSNGEYILPLDADDYIDAGYLLKAIDIFTNDDNVKLVYCNAQKFGAENGDWFLPDYNYIDLLKGNLIFCSAVFKKSAFLNAGMYDDLMLGGLEDWELWIRLLDEQAIVKKLPETCFFYRTKQVSMNRMDRVKIEEQKYKIFLKHINIYKKHFPSPITLLEENKVLRAMYKHSFDYRIGNFLVNPIRKAISYFKPN